MELAAIYSGSLVKVFFTQLDFLMGKSLKFSINFIKLYSHHSKMVMLSNQ